MNCTLPNSPGADFKPCPTTPTSNGPWKSQTRLWTNTGTRSRRLQNDESQMSEPKEPLWITYEQAIAIHSRQLRRFGGAPGLRDEGMLRSALERPSNKWRHERAGMAELAAAYAFGLAKNHAFVDGNKRIAFMAMMGFLLKNGVAFDPEPAQSTSIILSLAAGDVSGESLTRWIRDNWPPEPAK